MSLDAARIGAAISSVADIDPALGAGLAPHAGSLQYTLVLQALQLGRDDRLNDEAPHE